MNVVAHRQPSRSSVETRTTQGAVSVRGWTSSLVAGLDLAQLVGGISPLDATDAVEGILSEAQSVLGLAQDSLERLYEDGERKELNDVCTVLLALQRRLEVAAELSRRARRATATEIHGDAGDEAPSSSARPRG